MTASQIGGLCLFIGLLAHQIVMEALREEERIIRK